MSFVNCFILGDEADHIFPANITSYDESRNITSLIDQIKDEMKSRLSHIDASYLELYEVSIHFDDPQLTTFVPNPQSKLPLITELRKFKAGLEDHVHVIVKAPGMSQNQVA